MPFGDLLRRLLPAWKGRLTVEEMAEDLEAARLIQSLLREARGRPYLLDFEPKQVPAGEALLAASPESQVTAVHAALGCAGRLDPRGLRYRHWQEWRILCRTMGALLARRLPVNEADLIRWLLTLGRLLERTPEWRGKGSFLDFPLLRLLGHVERHVEEFGPSPALLSALQRLRPPVTPAYNADRKALARLDALRGAEAASPLVEPRDPWAVAAGGELDQLPPERRQAWEALLAHARTADGARPARKWLNQARELAAGVGEAEVTAALGRWLPLAREPADRVLDDRNSEVLKGLAWTCAGLGEGALAGPLGAAAQACYRKISNYGARSAKAGNACLWALGELGTPEAVAELTRLRRRVKYRAGQAGIAKALAQAAERAGISPDELEEISAPTCGLEPPGVLREQFGEFTAEINVVTGRPEWRWLDAAGKPQKTVPAAVRADHAADLKELKQAAKELEEALTAQRHRLERLLLADRCWPLPVWRERYLEHPLVGLLARRLVWHFNDGERRGPGAWDGEQLVDALDRPLEGLTDAAEVRLWHPLGFAPEVVLAWREWLERHRVTQPFKQAHRELYLLTDAELETATYSNRFAAHVLRQHQFNALCRERGWQAKLQGGWDPGDATPRLLLPRWGLRAEFWVDGALDLGETAMGVVEYVATDQVRFYRAEEREPLPLAEVPALAFSEVMRDVDLFVGVASVGNDPSWRDRGDEGPYGGYWYGYAFGDLSATAQTRRAVLERLLPRLKIAGRCRIEGRYLLVRGDRRSYKIHLGSGNILMEPNDQYLCIVPGRGDRALEGVFLPFEGDRLLSIILSKAFLLADDAKIKDPSILSQLRR